MTEQFESLQDLAQESGFQLLVCRDYLTWLSALARAIQLAHVHGESEIGEGLASIAKYLGDSGVGAASAAVSDMDKIAEPDTAPQNDDLADRGAEVEGCQ